MVVKQNEDLFFPGIFFLFFQFSFFCHEDLCVVWSFHVVDKQNFLFSFFFFLYAVYCVRFITWTSALIEL
jgi:hypothetical protein